VRRFLVPLALLATGCTVSPADVGIVPSCPDGAEISDSVVLISQAVPTAQLVPCVDSLPNGWGVANVEIVSGRALIDLAGDDFGTVAVTATLTASCDVQGAAVSSDRPGTQRYDDAPANSSDLAGTRRYVFDGGCVTYTYDLRPTRRDVAVDEALLAVSLLPRDAVSQSVRAEHDDRVELDPASPNPS
jgi:hypothetical protein